MLKTRWRRTDTSERWRTCWSYWSEYLCVERLFHYLTVDHFNKMVSNKKKYTSSLLYIVTKDIDVNEHKKLSNITLRHKLKYNVLVKEHHFYCCSTFNSIGRVFNNGNNPYHKMSMKRALTCSWAVLLTLVDKHNIWASFLCCSDAIWFIKCYYQIRGHQQEDKIWVKQSHKYRHHYARHHIKCTKLQIQKKTKTNHKTLIRWILRKLDSLI